MNGGVMKYHMCTGVVLLTLAAADSNAQAIDRQRDRGPGVPVSMFGTYIEPRELIIYPFFEYYNDKDAEYSPNDFGFGLDQDFRGRYRASEGLIFIGYGFSERLAVEFEAAVISARQYKSPDDPTAMPARIEESGLGDVEGQVRWRWKQESERSPEYFSYFETVFPLQKDKLLIGTQAWEFKFGMGLVRGFSWGTATFRAAVEYDAEENKAGLGEYAVEYLRKVSSGLRLLAAVEGSEDEIELITEAQVWFSPRVVLKLNNALGVTSKATDWAPEVGLMIRLGR
jgi:hypothetical protein